MRPSVQLHGAGDGAQRSRTQPGHRLALRAQQQRRPTRRRRLPPTHRPQRAAFPLSDWQHSATRFCRSRSIAQESQPSGKQSDKK